MKNALLVIDMQNDFIDGALGTKEAVAIVPAVKEAILAAKENGDRIIFTRDTHFENYMETFEGLNLPVPHCIKGTDGWQIRTELNTDDSVIIDKLTFGYTGWKKYLDDIEDITLIGLCTDICVISNALIIRALYPEKKIRILEAATAGVTPESMQAALTTARCCQITVI